MTAQESDIPPSDSDASSEGAFDQGDIDSMFGPNDAVGEPNSVGADSAPGSDEPVADKAAIDQSSIDAMFGGDGPVEPVAEEVVENGNAAIDQSDIDNMFGGDSTDATEAAPAANAPVEDERLDTLGRPFDAAAAEMAAAIAEEKEAAAAVAAAAPAPAPVPAVHTESVSLEDFGSSSLASIDPKRVSMLSDVKLRVRVELGRSRMLVENVLQLGEGSVVELQKAAGDPVDIIVNERLIARGEVLVLNDNFCVRISEIVATDPHRVTV